MLLIGNLQVPNIKNDLQPKMVLIHQNLTFSTTAIKITWRVLNDRICAYYQLVVSQNCDLSSKTMVLINRTMEESITLEPEVLSNFLYFNLTACNEQGDQCVKNFFWRHFNLAQGVSLTIPYA